MSYECFLQSKRLEMKSSGFKPNEINQKLFEFQQDIVNWSLKKGRSAIFAGTGLGKTAMQLEWAKKVYEHSGKNVLILAPLAVSSQTVREGNKFNISVNQCRTQEDVCSGINITNYEMLHNFDPNEFSGIVLDESSILKSYSGTTRTQIIEYFVKTPYKLACTATPAPNDYMELGNHAEFLGVMSRGEMLAMFFVHDGGETQKWRLKGHAVESFWQWVSSWAVMLTKPSDLGYEDGKFALPALNMHQVTIQTEKPTEGHLFAVEAQTLQERQAARRTTVVDRVQVCADLVNNTNEPWIIWCDLNSESEALSKIIKESWEIKGGNSNEYKEKTMLGFATGEVKRLITKPSIAGYGMNWQHCNKIAFVGLSDSFEQIYQAIRRCWRFGQEKEVDVYMITADTEGAVVKNIQRKEKEFNEMLSGMISATQEITKENIKGLEREVRLYKEEIVKEESYTLYLGDCVDKCKEIENDSIHYSIFSPPFASLYTYSNSERDMGNCKGMDDFMEHFRFLVKDLYRVLMPGRLLSFHCMNLPTSKQNDGYIGIRDFRGELIKLFQSEGFIYHSEVCIWKDPVTAMQRTKALGLLHKTIRKDSSMNRQGIPDYLVTMRKPGDNPEPISHTHEEFPVSLWQRYASPIWMDINPSKTLQKDSAREEKDERHICPLQLEVIERSLEIWTNKNDIVLSPFMGIGSEGFVSIKMDRRFVGIELKEAYFKQAKENIKIATVKNDSLFSQEETCSIG